MRSFKLTVSYDGTGLVGWQRQATGSSIQALLEDALSDLDGRPVAVAGAGRTDAGVHAAAQTASVSLMREIDARSLVGAVNVRLPEAVRVVSAVAVPANFHARFDARSKTYRYRIWNRQVLNPFERAYSWHIPAPVLDARAMDAAAALLTGVHDFAAFQGTGTETYRTERTVLASRVVRALGGPAAVPGEPPARVEPPEATGGADLIAYDITGEGFLRHMVRNIVGTLVEVGRGRRPVEWVAEVLASKERARAGPTAPPQGLFLMAVDYLPRPDGPPLESFRSSSSVTRSGNQAGPVARTDVRYNQGLLHRDSNVA